MTITKVSWFSIAAMLTSACSDEGGESTPVDAGRDVVLGDECETEADCQAMGTPPCGWWECRAGICDVVCDNCQEEDFDGYGEGLGCAGDDCDDADDAVHPGAAESCDNIDNDCDALVDQGIAQACYTGPNGTRDEGECRDGQQYCSKGDFGPCIGEIVSTGSEACNGEDDDCDGATDEDLGNLACGLGACATTVPACAAGAVQSCLPLAPTLLETCDGTDQDCDGAIDEEEACGCVHVAPPPLGNFANDGSALLPLDTIDSAIGLALSTGSLRVCVAAGTYVGAVTMANGVSVYGGYDELTWARDVAGNVTEIEGMDDLGILFASNIATTTVFDGFTVTASDGWVESAAVTVQGSESAILTNNIIAGANLGQSTYGVNVTNGATPLIARSRIGGGEGTTLSVGVRSNASAPVIADNCDDFGPNGSCAKVCGDFPEPSFAIFGRTAAGGGDSFSVLLQDSPGARVSRNTACELAGGGGDDEVAAIRIVGGAAGTVIDGNNVFAGGTLISRGIAVESCGGSAPWIVRNFARAAAIAGGVCEGVRSVGDCHPIVQENVILGAFGGTESPVGVRCGRANDEASRCVLIGNTIAGLWTVAGGAAGGATAVHCEAGACASVSGNQIVGIAVGFGMPGSAAQVYGLVLEATGPVVRGNLIWGGVDGACGTTTTVAVDARDAFARIENNLIFPGTCAAVDPVGGLFAGLRVTFAENRNELDVHSNDIFGFANETTCTGAAVLLDAAAAATEAQSRGVFRNNILYGGGCDTSHALAEGGALADPRIVENNLFWAEGTGALYQDEASDDLDDIADINGLRDAQIANNLSDDPTFVSLTDLHLQSTSECVDAGTPVGAPATDFEGRARPVGDEVDIGALEYAPP